MNTIMDIGCDTRNEPIPTNSIGLKSATYSDRLPCRVYNLFRHFCNAYVHCWTSYC